MGARIQNTVDAAILLGFVERYENLEAEKKEIGEDEKVVLAEARVAGLDPKVLKHCVKVRKQKPADYHEARALADMYLSALGLVEPPLFRAANLIDVDILARGSVVEAMKRFVPEHGSITIDAGAGAPLRLTRGLDGEVTVEDVVPDRDERGGPEPASGEASRGRGSRKARREAALPPQMSIPRWRKRSAFRPPATMCRSFSIHFHSATRAGRGGTSAGARARAMTGWGRNEQAAPQGRS